MEVQPLNLELYKRLQHNFGTVLIANSGEGFISQTRRGIDGRPKEVVSQSGEYYRVCCPFCRDTRHRLWINHKFGVYDNNTHSKNTHLAYCYNEQCLVQAAGRRQHLENMVFQGMNWSQRRSIQTRQGAASQELLVEVSLPGPVTRIDMLPADHRAVTYLISRGCDITELGDSFGVAYCEFAEPRYRAAEDRIVAPVYMHGKLVGWQCRHIGELDWKELGIAKYYTRPGMPKRLTLYNFDSARTFPLVVLTEGISDVWAVGPQAVALLGSKLHTSQERLVCQAWGTGTVVVMLDPDARESAEDIVRRLEPRISGGVVPIHLDGVDPGDLSREALWAIIINQLEQHGYTMVRTNDDSDSSDSGLPVLRTASEQ